MRVRVEFLRLLPLLLFGCAGPTFTPDAAPEYLVIRDQTPLYRYGPQQGGAPEAFLNKDDHLRMLRHEFGYSFVQADDAQTGYVANENLAPAPPAPQPAPEPASERETPRSLPIVDDAPLPKPDLRAAPEDAPTGVR